MILVSVTFIPEGTDVHTSHLWRPQYLANIPEQRSIHSHQVGGVYLVRLVEDAANSVRIGTEHLHHLLELVGDVQLVCIEGKEDKVSPLCHPRANGGVLIVPPDTLFATREHPWRVDKRDLAEHLRRHGHGLKVAQESRPERGETLVGQLWETRGGTAVNQPLLLPVHNHDELVRAGLWPHVKVNAVPPSEPLHHRRLACAVLTQEQDLRSGLELLSGGRRHVKMAEVGEPLQGKDVSYIQLPQLSQHHLFHRITQILRLRYST
mmetsp:Transcript_57918/g.154333  ORF Transcript_57918/g.154333 Transcript_57918/m.154333 type:complete len:264 (+) Transcript_57918:616-1407(+)